MRQREDVQSVLTVPGRGCKGEWAFNAALVCAFAAFAAALVDRLPVFGSQAGNWVYPYIRAATLIDAAVAAAGVVGFGLLLHVTLRLVERRPIAAVAAWIALGAGFHLICRALYPIPLGRIVASDQCTSFYSVARRIPPAELLARFQELVQTLPAHAASNMPGKIIIFSFLESISLDPAVLGVLIVGIADLSGILVYWLAVRLFRDRRTGLVALALFLLFPARIAFFPLLNVLSPLFVLLPLLIFDFYLESRRDLLLWLLGAGLYLIWFVDPILFPVGLVLCGFLARRLAAGTLPWRGLWKVAAYPLGGLLACCALIWLVFRFDTLGAFRGRLAAAHDFNLGAGRPYGVWVIANLKEFFYGAGFAQSLLFLAALFLLARALLAARGIARGFRAAVADPGANLLLFLAATLVILDLLGVNRGETSRLWIYLAVLLQVAVARFCVTRFAPATTYIVVAASVVQTVLMVGTVGFLLC